MGLTQESIAAMTPEELKQVVPMGFLLERHEEGGWGSPYRLWYLLKAPDGETVGELTSAQFEALAKPYAVNLGGTSFPQPTKGVWRAV